MTGLAALAPATSPRAFGAQRKLLVVDLGHQSVSDRLVGDLPSLLTPRDLLVLNDAATLPASLQGTTAQGDPIEVRLAGQLTPNDWRAVLFGAGDWRLRTEARPKPPAIVVGSTLFFKDAAAKVLSTDVETPRLLRLRFEHPPLSMLYRRARPVQYAYLERPLALWDVQTAFGSRPWASEAPSAGLMFSFELLLALRRRGVSLATVTHAAGLSSTGDDALDARLPFDERSDMPAQTLQAIAETRARQGRIIAVGTTVARALEGATSEGRLQPGARVTSLKLGPAVRPGIVDGLLTGMHAAGSSHFELLQAFAPYRLLERANALAQARGYLGHEFGDAMVLLP